MAEPGGCEVTAETGWAEPESWDVGHRQPLGSLVCWSEARKVRGQSKRWSTVVPRLMEEQKAASHTMQAHTTWSQGRWPVSQSPPL